MGSSVACTMVQGSSVACGRCDREKCHRSSPSRCCQGRSFKVEHAPPLPPMGMHSLKAMREQYRCPPEPEGATEGRHRRLFVRHAGTGVEYACRRLRKRGMAVSGAVTLAKYFARLSAVEHPNICRFIEAFEDEDHLYLIYEKAGQKTLFEHIQGARRFTESDAADCLRQMAGALAVAHQYNIFHGGLGPQDAVIKEAEADARHPLQVKIRDMGIGFLLQRPPTELAFPEARWDGSVEAFAAQRWSEPEREAQVCLMSCMPPEVANGTVRGDLTVIPKAARKLDIYGLGVLCYLMLCGRLPFTPGVGQTPKSFLLDIVRGDVQFFWADWGKYPQEARECVQLLLCPRAHQRPEAIALLQHPWLLMRGERVSRTSVERTLRDLRENALSSLLPRLVLRLTAQWRVSKAQRRSLEKVFRLLDTKDDGVLDGEELTTALQKYTPDIAEDSESVLLRVDRDGSGFVSLDEFCVIAVSQEEMLRRGNLVSVFHAVDVKSRGAIEVGDVAKAVLDFDLQVLGPGHAFRAVKARTEAELKAGPLPSPRPVSFDEFVDLVHLRPLGALSVWQTGCVTPRAKDGSCCGSGKASDDEAPRLAVQRQQPEAPGAALAGPNQKTLRQRLSGGDSAACKLELGHDGDDEEDFGEQRPSVSSSPRAAREPTEGGEPAQSAGEARCPNTAGLNTGLAGEEVEGVGSPIPGRLGSQSRSKSAPPESGSRRRQGVESPLSSSPWSDRRSSRSHRSPQQAHVCQRLERQRRSLDLAPEVDREPA